MACLGPSLPFHLTVTVGVQASSLPRPAVINAILIFQTPASPFYLTLIKVASRLQVWCRSVNYPASQDLHDVIQGAVFAAKQYLHHCVVQKTGKSRNPLKHERVGFIFIRRLYILEISCKVSSWCTGLKWQTYYTHYHLKAYVLLE